jgi:hypothetical protein
MNRGVDQIVGRLSSATYAGKMTTDILFEQPDMIEVMY